MEITFELDKTADIPFLKNLLSQLKGIKNIHVDEGETFSWEEIESSEVFKKVLEQSQKDYEEGRYEDYSEELMDSIFNK